MHTVPIHEAKTHLSRLLQECLRGDTVIIARGKTPIAKLVALSPPAVQRRLGGGKKVVTYMADDFDAPLDDFEAYSP